MACHLATCGGVILDDRWNSAAFSCLIVINLRGIRLPSHHKRTLTSLALVHERACIRTPPAAVIIPFRLAQVIR